MASRSRPKPKPTSSLKTRPANVEVKVDRALKRAWDAARHKLAEAKREGAGAFDTLWETIGIIIDHHPPLYLAGGYATAKAFLADFVEENERTAQRLIRVAKYASPDEEAKFGVSKLDAAIAFIEAKAGAPAKGRVPVDFAKLKIPVVREKETRNVSLVDATVEEVRSAIRSVARSGASKGSKPARSPVVNAITTALKAPHLHGIKVSLAHEEVTLSAIPVAHLQEVGRELAKLKVAIPTNTKTTPAKKRK